MVVIVMMLIMVLSYSFIIQIEILSADTDMGILSNVYEVEINTSYILHYKDDTYELFTQEGD